MFGLFRKKKVTIAQLLGGWTDHHSHILPGVDDGVKDMETSLKLLSYYESLGIRALWCTPHVMEDMSNTTAGLQERFAGLKAAYSGPVELHLAAEYMLDSLFEERLEADDLLPMTEDDEQQLLVETSYFNPPMDFTGLLQQIKSKGYYPVLAHPERYVYMDKRQYAALKEKGVRFQLNLSSLAGAYGPVAEKKSRELLKAGSYELSGSDIHSFRNTEFWQAPAPEALRNLIETKK